MKTILVTGATGYIGGRLIPRLLEKGYKVRCLVRSPERLAGHHWAGSVEVVRGDVFRNEGLEKALAGADAAYYPVNVWIFRGLALEISRRAAAVK